MRLSDALHIHPPAIGESCTNFSRKQEIQYMFCATENSLLPPLIYFIPCIVNFFIF